MTLHISINGRDISELHLTPLQGTLDALMKPTKYKAIVTNENAAMDGSNVVTTPSAHKVQKRDVTIPFLLRSTSLAQLQTWIDKLQDVLVEGKDGKGYNELYCAETKRTYYLVFSEISAYTNFGLGGAARISIKFVEPNPKNRV